MVVAAGIVSDVAVVTEVEGARGLTAQICLWGV